MILDVRSLAINMETGMSRKLIAIAILAFGGAISAGILIIALSQSNMGSKTKETLKQAEVFEATGETSCHQQFTVAETPTSGVCDADSCIQVACADPHNCPVDECTTNDECREAPPAKKYKTCQNQACVEVVCPDQANCPANTCTSDSDCKTEEIDETPICKELLASPKKGTADLKVRFSVDATDPMGGSIEEYQFEFGDGESLESANDTVYHIYKKGGKYEAKVQVVNGKGQKSDDDANDDCKVEVKVDEETHMACVSQECKEVEGVGDNLCANDSQCQQSVYTTHLACVNSACIAVSGGGSNLCSVDTDCQVNPQPVTQIPATGSTTNWLLALVLPLLLIVGGLALVL